MKEDIKKIILWLFARLLTNFVAFLLILFVIRLLGIIAASGKTIVILAKDCAAVFTLIESIFIFVQALSAYVQKKIRLWKVKRRIIRQAKAAGAWSIPIAGGKVLDMYAEAFGLKREPGETDVHLRARCMAAAGEDDGRRRKPWAK